MRPRQVIGLAVDAMASHQNIWQCYFNDFITHKLKLVDPGHAPQDHAPQDHAPHGDIAQQILQTYFEQLHVSEMPKRMVELHCYVNVGHLFLAKMATTLRPLSSIAKVWGGGGGGDEEGERMGEGERGRGGGREGGDGIGRGCGREGGDGGREGGENISAYFSPIPLAATWRAAVVSLPDQLACSAAAECRQVELQSFGNAYSPG